jgi:uncharacterized protein YbaP (TraB family)
MLSSGILSPLRRFLSDERELSMAWEIEKDGRRSHLLGAAHFFPYRFTSSLRRYVRGAKSVLVEGPLDEDAGRKVVAAGSARRGASLCDALDAVTVHKINRRLRLSASSLSLHRLYWEAAQGDPKDWLAAQTRGLTPWMAFMQLWNRYRAPQGWTYSTDLDVIGIAADLGKRVHPLESIEEQIEALHGIPLERIVAFLADVDWDEYVSTYVKRYLAGDLEALMATARAFPTFCAAIVDRRDPILYARMRPFLEEGGTFACVGVVHCPEIIRLLRAGGYRVVPAGGR